MPCRRSVCAASVQSSRPMSGLLSSANLYVHGGAGTGKTVATMASIRAHGLLYGNEAVAVTASTGVAAGLLAGGQTPLLFGRWAHQADGRPTA